MAKAAALNLDIIATADKALETFDKVKDKAGSSFGAMKAAAVGAAGAVLAGLGDATKAASEHEVNVAKLGQAYKDAGVPADDMKASLEEIDKASRRTGQSAEDNIAAYTKLVAATHDSAQAHSELATAEDLAAFKGISVSDAAQAINSAMGGNTRALKEMGLATKDAAGHQLDAQQIMEELTAAVHGQADAMGDTAAGKMARYKETLEQTKVSVGEALLPALTKLLDMLQPLFNWLSQNTEILKVLAPIVAGLAGFVLAVSAATKVWSAAQTVLNVVMDANPIGLVIIAIGLLVVAVVEVIRHWDEVSAAISIAWGWLRDFGEWVGAHWRPIVEILLGPLGLLIANFQTVERVIEDVIHALEDVGRKVSEAMRWLSRLPSGAGGLLSSLNPFAAPPGGPAATPYAALATVQVFVQPGDDFAEAVYRGLREYQHRHARPELRSLFGG
jgi:hypothetical protein